MLENMKWLLKKTAKYKRLMLMIMFMAGIETVIDLIDPLIIRYVGNELPKGGVKVLVVGTTASIVSVLIANLIGYHRLIQSQNLGELCYADIQHEVVYHFLKRDFQKIDNMHEGEMENMVNGDCHMIYQIMRYLPRWITNVITSIIGAVIIFGKLSKLLLIITIPVLLLILIFELVGTKLILEKPYAKLREERRSLLKFRTDRFNGIKEVVGFNMVETDYKRYVKHTDDYITKANDQNKAQGRYNLVINMGNGLLCSLILALGGFFVVHGDLKPVDLIVYYSNIWMIMKPILSIADLIDTVTEANVAIGKIREELAIKPEINTKEGALEPEIVGNVDLKNVTFAYNDSDEPTLKNVSLHVNPGEMIAFVGPSGSGKSTIANLIPRYYDATEGEIEIDGISTKEFDLGYLRDRIGMVRQDSYLFNETVLDNIRYAKPDATKEEIIRAAKAADAYDFIMNLPNQFDTEIGKNGVKLSGGQKQRIAIARLFLKNPSICIFDEATSALDNVSQRYVQRAMDDLAKGRTTIVIAHRLDTVMNADQIYYVENGSIVEHGTHQELMALHGLYYSLYKSEEEASA